MAYRKVKPCSVEGCGLPARGHYTMCMAHHDITERAKHWAALDAVIKATDAERARVGLPDTWGCLDPDCEICS
jgi:hypothetical protein